MHLKLTAGEKQLFTVQMVIGSGILNTESKCAYNKSPVLYTAFSNAINSLHSAQQCVKLCMYI